MPVSSGAEGHDVVCLGEALVDFMPDRRGQAVRDVRRWTPCLGGAPANVAVGVARLGGKSALVGATGADEFGSFIKQNLSREGVDVSWLRQTSEGKTGLGFVSLTKGGERSFTFYRQRAAETFLDQRDTAAAADALEAARILHVGTNSLVQEEAREAVRGAVSTSFLAGRITSSDPNLRLHLWPDPSVLRGLLDELLPKCAIVKLSVEEIRFVTDTDDVDEALTRLERHGVLLPVVTLGARGAAVRFRGDTFRVRAPRVKVVDTTGAGDGFMTGFLFSLAKRCRTRADLEALDPNALSEFAALGCLIGSRVVQKLGAVAGLPRKASLRAALRRVSRAWRARGGPESRTAPRAR